MVNSGDSEYDGGAADLLAGGPRLGREEVAVVLQDNLVDGAPGLDDLACFGVAVEVTLEVGTLVEDGDSTASVAGAHDDVSMWGWGIGVCGCGGM